MFLKNVGKATYKYRTCFLFEKIASHGKQFVQYSQHYARNFNFSKLYYLIPEFSINMNTYIQDSIAISIVNDVALIVRIAVPYR